MQIYYRNQKWKNKFFVQCEYRNIVAVRNIPLHLWRDAQIAIFFAEQNSSVIRQKGESQYGCFKKSKHAKCSEKTNIFRKIWRALFSSNTRFAIRPFALLPTNYVLFCILAAWMLEPKWSIDVVIIGRVWISTDLIYSTPWRENNYPKFIR